jgi:hypothetical protein
MKPKEMGHSSLSNPKLYRELLLSYSAGRITLTNSINRLIRQGAQYPSVLNLVASRAERFQVSQFIIPLIPVPMMYEQVMVGATSLTPSLEELPVVPRPKTAAPQRMQLASDSLRPQNSLAPSAARNTLGGKTRLDEKRLTANLTNALGAAFAMTRSHGTWLTTTTHASRWSAAVRAGANLWEHVLDLLDRSRAAVPGAFTALPGVSIVANPYESDEPWAE